MSDQNKAAPAKKPRKAGFLTGNSSLMALFILGFIALWMLSGEIVVGGSDTDKVPPIASQETDTGTSGAYTIASGPASPSDTQKTAKIKKLFAVRAELFSSRPRNEILQIRARSEADVSVKIRAETSGRVIKIFARKGDLVKQGDVLCKLDEGARRATLLQAQALLAQTKSDYQAAAKLSKRGFSAKLNVNAKRPLMMAPLPV